MRNLGAKQRTWNFNMMMRLNGTVIGLNNNRNVLMKNECGAQRAKKV